MYDEEALEKRLFSLIVESAQGAEESGLIHRMMRTRGAPYQTIAEIDTVLMAQRRSIEAVAYVRAFTLLFPDSPALAGLHSSTEPLGKAADAGIAALRHQLMLLYKIGE